MSWLCLFDQPQEASWWLKVEGNTVIFTVTREVKKTDFTAEEYASMVTYYDVMFELTQVKIVLKK